MPKAVYRIEFEPANSLIVGWHLYRKDEGESCEHILAQGLSKAEAEARLKALQRLKG